MHLQVTRMPRPASILACVMQAAGQHSFRAAAAESAVRARRADRPPPLLVTPSLSPSTHLHLQSVSDYRRNKLPNKVDPAPISYSDNLTPDSDLVSENLPADHSISLLSVLSSSYLDTLTRIATTQMNGRPRPLGFLILSTGTLYDRRARRNVRQTVGSDFMACHTRAFPSFLLTLMMLKTEPGGRIDYSERKWETRSRPKLASKLHSAPQLNGRRARPLPRYRGRRLNLPIHLPHK